MSYPENMTQIAAVVESSIKIYEETCNKHGVEIKTVKEKSLPEVLIDPFFNRQGTPAIELIVEEDGNRREGHMEDLFKVFCQFEELIGSGVDPRHGPVSPAGCVLQCLEIFKAADGDPSLSSVVL